jgi:hypothetical protein
VPTEEVEVTVEIVCTDLPGEDWEGLRPLHLGIQRDRQMTDATSAGSQRVVLRAPLRARRHADGSVSFLGPFAHGPRTERFIYLVWAIVEAGIPVRMVGRIKLHLNHIPWTSVQKAAGSKTPMRVTLILTDARNKPVMASIRTDRAQWQLP